MLFDRIYIYMEPSSTIGRMLKTANVLKVFANQMNLVKENDSTKIYQKQRIELGI